MRIYVKVIPGSSKSKIVKISEGEYKAWIAAPPVRNKANKMLIETLAGFFNVSKSSVEIIGGRTASKKIIEILN